LLSYGVDLTDTWGRVATYVDRLLLEQPGDLPVQFSTKFEMTLNLRIAKALGVVCHSRSAARRRDNRMM
jgi:putative ABC transport system substrate-binding protein